MNRETLIDAIGQIDATMIDRHIQMRARLEGKSGAAKRPIWKAVLPLAAALALIVTAIPLWTLTRDRTEHSGKLPDYENADFSLEDINDLFNGGQPDGGSSGSHAYRIATVPDPSDLPMAEIPRTESLPIYQQRWIRCDRAAFADFVDQRLPLVCDALGYSTPDYEIRGDESDDIGATVFVGENFDRFTGDYYDISFSQNGRTNFLLIDRTVNDITSNEKGLKINGRIATVDWRQSDEEIIQSLAKIRSELSEIVGRDFPDVKVDRDYAVYEPLDEEEAGLGKYHFTVYFYDASSHPLNEYIGKREAPYSDYLAMDFSCPDTETLMYNEFISFFQFRNDVTEICVPYLDARLISLEEAEQLLAAGITFAGFSSSIGGGFQQESDVDFTDYDLVGVTYVYRSPQDNPNRGYSPLAMPFYVFCKEMGTTPGGNRNYAEVYVPAFEVSGIAEYVQKREEYSRRIEENKKSDEEE